jgi:acyl-CoA thioesterase
MKSLDNDSKGRPLDQIEGPWRSFDAAVAWPRDAMGVHHGELSADWLQGRTGFGGLSAAIALQAALAELPIPLPLRSFDIAFLAPMTPGDGTARAVILRAGRAVTWVEATIEQNGEEVLRALAVFGPARPSSVAYAPTPISPRKRLDDAPPIPYVEGVVPRFVRHFDILWGEGLPPFSASPEPITGGWVRHREQATGLPALLGLIDAWPAPVLPTLSAPAPASTVRWTVQPLSDVGSSVDGTNWHHFRSETIAAGDGFATVVGTLSDAAGQPLVFSEQLVAVFDRT